MNDANIMQRIFDALPTDRGITVLELQKATRFTRMSIESALDRLRARRCLQPTDRINGVNLYRRRVDAERPIDGRGKKRQQEQEAA